MIETLIFGFIIPLPENVFAIMLTEGRRRERAHKAPARTGFIGARELVKGMRRMNYQGLPCWSDATRQNVIS